MNVSGRSGSPLNSNAPPERCGSGGGPAMTMGEGKVKLVGPAGPIRPDVLVLVDAIAGVQPLPRCAASKSTL